MTVSNGSNNPPAPPALEPTTSRTGGRSAKLVALAVVVVLAGVVYVGVSGGSSGAAVPSSSPRATNPAIAARSPAPEPPAPIEDDTGPVVPIIDRTRAPQYQFLGMALSVGTEEVTGPMSEVRPGFFSGGYRIKLPATAATATLALSATQATVSHESLVPIGQWQVPLTLAGTSSSDPNGGVVFTAGQQPTTTDTSDPLAARIISNGFRVTGLLDVQPDEEVLTIEVAVVSAGTFPVAAYSLTTVDAGDQFTADFFEVSPGKYTAGLVVPDSFHGRTLTIRVMVTPLIRPGMHALEVTTIGVSVSSKRNFHPTSSQTSAEPDTAAIHRADIFGAGYQLEAQTRLAIGQRLIDFTLTINPIYPEATQTP